MNFYLTKNDIKLILEKNNIIEILSSLINLKKSGHNYSSICPFHKEKTASFFVNELKQKYYCFGCKKSGNIINFLMEFKKISFLAAIEFLTGNEFKKKNKNIELFNLNTLINEISDIFFQNIKTNKDSELGFFLKKRAIDFDIITKFKLGFVGNSWNFLFKKFLPFDEKKKYLIYLGLLVKKNDKIYDRFRNRIIFPIRNVDGKILGFGGRSLNDIDKPKYINSTESVLFSKKKEFYGLYESNIKFSLKKKYIIIVEGYFDVITLHKNEITNSVAVLGSVFTKEHFKNIRRYCDKIIFCFDGDKAGRQASLRTAYLCLSYIFFNTFIGFAFLPVGEDPDSYVKKFGKNKFIDLVEKPIYILDYLYFVMSNDFNLNNIYNKINLIENFKNLLNFIKDVKLKNLVLDYFIKKIYNEKNKDEKQKKNKLQNLIPIGVKATIILLLNKDFLYKIDINKLMLNKNIKIISDIGLFMELIIMLSKNINYKPNEIFLRSLNKFNYNYKSYLNILKTMSKDTISTEFDSLLKIIYNFGDNDVKNF